MGGRLVSDSDRLRHGLISTLTATRTVRRFIAHLEKLERIEELQAFAVTILSIT